MTAFSVGWLVSNVVSNDHQELFSTELASSRLRAGVCIKGCMQAGIHVLPLNFRDPTHKPDLVFMGKYVPDSNTGKYLDDSGTRWQIWLDKVRAIKSYGAKLVVDYTDNHFQNPNIVGDFYRTIRPSIDAIVVPSERMKDHLRSHWNGPVTVIPEPIEVSVRSPKTDSDLAGQPITALWFGHVTNLEYLFKFMATEMHKAAPDRLIILTNNNPAQAVKQAMTLAPKKTKVALGEWSLAAMEKAASVSHYALIPSDKNDQRKNGASPGRLLTCLALGLPVVAEPLDSYLPFSSYFASIGSPDAENCMRDPFVYSDAVRKSQETVMQDFSVSSVGARWGRLVSQLLE
jgi:hypothetical protein